MSAPSQQDRKRGGFLGLFRSSSSDAKVKSQGGAPKDAKQATTAGPDSSRLHRLSIVSTNAGIAHTITESTQSSVEIEHVVASTAIKDSAANVESSTLRTKPCLDVFQQNIDPPSVRVPLPEIHTRISATPQLALCMGLLPKNGSTIDQQEDLLQYLRSDTTARLAWVQAVKQDPMEQDHLHWLGARMVEEFAKDASKDSTEIAEMVLLGPVLNKETYRKLLECFISAFTNATILDVDLLQGVVQLIQSSPPESLLSDDLVRILSILRARLQGTHQQSSVHHFHLTLAVSRVLDVMADHKVKDLNRVVEHEPLSGVLSGLKGSSDPYLMYQACYAFQALQYVPDDETVLQAIIRHSSGVVDGLVKVTTVFKLDVGAVLEGLGSLQAALGGAVGTAVSVYGGICPLLESGRGVFASLKDGLGSGQKRPWYSAIRAANGFAYAGQLRDLNRLINEAPCRRDPLFQWGICQLLGEIASDTIWDTNVRQQAITILGELYKNDLEWGQDESVRTWMLSIIGQLGAIEDQAVKITAQSLLQELKQEPGTVSRLPYPLRNRLPLPTSSPTLARVQNIPYVEYDLHMLRKQRLEEHNRGVYVSLQAKPSSQATDDTLFPLMEKTLEFLTGRCRVFLVLGDSGAGKSTFNLELEHALWKDYKKHGPIPLYINLPTIDNPAQELIEKQLHYYNFSDEQIQEMKLHREFFLICDGYDESYLKINLHLTNRFNQPGQWKVKMVVSCRSQYLGQDYRSRFRPQSTDQYQQSAAELLQEAVVAAFSKAQIQQYVEEHVKRLPEVDPLQDRPSWTVEEYMDKLVNIPHLMDLVSNPFLLTLALDSLPSIVASEKNLSAIRITRVQLYDSFVKRWLEVNRKRLESSPLNESERSELDLLIEDNFLYHGIRFQRELSTAIYIDHNREPVVKYTPIRDKDTWKEAFFSSKGQVKLLRESSAVSRSGFHFRFLHRSLLEYFYSRTIYDPRDYCIDAFDHDRDPIFGHKTSLAQMSIVEEPSIVQFLAERVQHDPSFHQQLLDSIEESKTNASVAVAASNAITVLVRAGVTFNGKNLQRAKIPGADVSGGQFDSAQFQGADLTRVKFSKSWLRLADVSGAHMEGVRFGELPYLEADSPVGFCAYSPDGKMLGVTLDGKTSKGIPIYDTFTWTKLHYLEGHSDMVVCIAFSPDSQRLVSGSTDKTVRVWDTTSGDELLVMEGHDGMICSVAFSPCGDKIASGSGDETVRLWNAQTGEKLFVLGGYRYYVQSVKFSPDGSQLISCSSEKTIRFWNARTGEPEKVLIHPTRALRCVTYSPNGRWAASGHERGHLQLWDAVTLEPGPILSGHISDITGIDFSPDSQWIASSSGDGAVRLWDASNGSLAAVVTDNNVCVSSIAFSADGLQIATVGDDRRIRLWEVYASRLSLDSRVGGPAIKLAYSRDGLSILSCDKDGISQRRDAKTGISALLPIEMPSQSKVTSVAYALDDRQLAFGYEDGFIRLWNCQSGAAGPVLEGHSSQIKELAYSPCCRWIVSVDESKVVLMWDLRDVALKPLPVDFGKISKGVVGAVAFQPTGGQFTIRVERGTVCQFDTQSNEPLGRIELDACVLTIVYSPNGQQVAFGTTSGIVYLWDLQSKEPSAALEGHEEWVKSIDYSPCGQWIASASDDMTVGIWHRGLSGETESWSRVHSMSSFVTWVENVAWNPVVPMEFATSTLDGSVQAWRVLIGKDGKVTSQMVWGSNLGRLCTKDTTLMDVVGLSPINQKLLVQRGAAPPSDELTYSDN